jgi:hypothetical protein
MARNSSGTMSAPGTYPPIADAIISLDDYKALIQDILNELTDSLSRSGKGGMIEALKLADGTQALPGLSFNGDATSGLYRSGEEIRLAILGALRAKFLATGVEVTGTVKASGGLADDATHGSRGGGSLHPEATGAVAGFLPAAHKTLLDGATNAPTASALVKRDTAGRAQFDAPFNTNDAANKGYVDGYLAEPIASVTAAGALVFGRGLTASGSNGFYTLTFSTPRSNTNYAVATSCASGEANVLSKTVNDFAVVTTNSAGTSAARDFDVIVRGLY